MFNEAKYRKMLLPSSGSVNDFVMHVYSKYADVDGNNKICQPGCQEVVKSL